MAMANLDNKAHVLALPSPFQGHINPFLDLSRKIAAEGITVSFINIPHYHSRIAPSLQPVFDRDRLPIRLLSLRDTYLPLPDLRVDGSLELFLRHISASMLNDVEDVVLSLMQQDPALPFTCLLADIRLPFAQSLADKLSIARIAFWTQSAASFSYHATVADGFHLPTDQLTVIDCIPGVPAHTISDTPAILRREIAGDFICNFMMKPFLQMKEACCVVINTFESLEAEATEAMRTRQGLNVFPIGPLLPLDNSTPLSSTSPKDTQDAEGEQKHMCLQWLDAHEPASVLYISFGTVVCLGESEFEELACGVEASGKAFLWSLRPDMVEGKPSFFIQAFTERTKQRGLVVPWVPQLEVLSHESIGGFLTHCGWNSAMESMCRGVPMIGYPKFSEQKLNMKCLVDNWKVCLAMEGDATGLLRRDDVERNVRELFTGQKAQELRCAAGKVRNTAACAMAWNGASLCNIKLLLKLVQEGASI